MRRIREKTHRLPEAAYFGRKAVSITACTEDRRTGLNEPEIVSAMARQLEKAATKHGCVVPVYCFMPDHLHLVMFGLENDSRPKHAVEAFKIASGRWLSDHRPNLSWQKDYHDHIVRRSEGFAAYVRYIALNPVRAGLAEHIHAYPFMGSIGCELEEVFLDAFWD